MSAFSWTMRPTLFTQIRWIAPVWRSSDERIKRSYREMERFFGVISPPIGLHASSPDMIAVAWMMQCEVLQVPDQVSRAVKESVATAVSASNTCPYCVTVHGTMLGTLDRKKDAKALEAAEYEAIEDPEIRAISLWARANARADTAADVEPPFPARQAPEIVAVATQFQYINRVVNVFLGERPLPRFAPAQMLGAVLPVLARMLASGYKNVPVAGATLDLLPDAPLPQSMAWAAGNERLAQVFGRISGAMEAAGERSVPASVRELVLAELAEWGGQPKGVSRAWVEQAVKALPADDRPAGRLALLTAFASYQVDESVMKDIRVTNHTDASVLELVSWASLAAAVRAADWMWISGSRPQLSNTP